MCFLCLCICLMEKTNNRFILYFERYIQYIDGLRKPQTIIQFDTTTWKPKTERSIKHTIYMHLMNRNEKQYYY